MAWTFDPKSGRNPEDYDIEDIDIYGFDDYWRNLETLPEEKPRTKAAIEHARSRGLPWFVGEWGIKSDVAAGAERAAGITSVGNFYASHEDCYGFMYWHANRGNLLYRLDDDPESAAAHRELAKSLEV